MQKLIKKSDFILIVLLGLILVSFVLFKTYKSKTQRNYLIAEISVKNQVVHRINLSKVDKPYTIKLDTNPSSVIEVDKGKIRYKSSDCPDKICVRTSFLDGNLQSAACVPAQSSVTVRATNEDTNTPDVVTY